MINKDNPIGIFDSGLGGLSVLKEAIKILPRENFIYFGDSLNAPYGVKSFEEVRDLTEKGIQFLLEKNVKAIVIACNTATAAADELREKYSKEVPILGIEPALKPAATMHKEGSIIVMATSRTLREHKFQKLVEKCALGRDIISMPAPGIVELVEAGFEEGEKMEKYLSTLFKGINLDEVSAIVLGCTHFPFAEKSIKKISHGKDLFDGAIGISNHLKRTLEAGNLLSGRETDGSVEIYNSKNEDMVNLSKRLLEK